MHAPAPRITTEDKIELTELLALYTWSYDCADLDTFSSTFTPDGSIEVMGRLMAEGRENMGDFFAMAQQVKNGRTWMHFSDQHIFRDYNGHSCTVFSYYLLPEADSNGENIQFRSMGYYKSLCVKVNGQWLFKKRTVHRWGGQLPWKKPD